MLLSAGDHVPVILLSEVVGKAAKAVPEQIGATALKVGIIVAGVTLTATVSVLVHPPGPVTDKV